MTERWRAVPGFPGYEVSDRGRVRSWRCRGHANHRAKKPKLRVPSIADGYPTVDLWINGRRFGRRVHGLVALAFLGPPKGRQVDRIDEVRTNNHLSNLRYLSHVENTRRSAKLNRRKVTAIQKRLRAGETQKAIAKRYGVDPSLISRIKTGEIWQ